MGSIAISPGVAGGVSNVKDMREAIRPDEVGGDIDEAGVGKTGKRHDCGEREPGNGDKTESRPRREGMNECRAAGSAH